MSALNSIYIVLYKSTFDELCYAIKQKILERKIFCCVIDEENFNRSQKLRTNNTDKLNNLFSTITSCLKDQGILIDTTGTVCNELIFNNIQLRYKFILKKIELLITLGKVDEKIYLQNRDTINIFTENILFLYKILEQQQSYQNCISPKLLKLLQILERRQENWTVYLDESVTQLDYFYSTLAKTKLPLICYTNNTHCVSGKIGKFKLPSVSTVNSRNVAFVSYKLNYNEIQLGNNISKLVYINLNLSSEDVTKPIYIVNENQEANCFNKLWNFGIKNTTFPNSDKIQTKSKIKLLYYLLFSVNCSLRKPADFHNLLNEIKFNIFYKKVTKHMFKVDHSVL